MSHPRDFERIRPWVEAMFRQQPFLNLVGVHLEAAGPGWAVISATRRADLLQSAGYFHGGLVATLFDATVAAAATGAAAVTPDDIMLTAEFKLNIFSPALGPVLRCRADVLKAGRNLIIVEAKIHNCSADGPEKLVAAGMATMVPGKRAPEVPGKRAPEVAG